MFRFWDTLNRSCEKLEIGLFLVQMTCFIYLPTTSHFHCKAFWPWSKIPFLQPLKPWFCMDWNKVKERALCWCCGLLLKLGETVERHLLGCQYRQLVLITLFNYSLILHQACRIKTVGCSFVVVATIVVCSVQYVPCTAQNFQLIVESEYSSQWQSCKNFDSDV